MTPTTFRSKIATINDLREILPKGKFKDRYGRKISVATHGPYPAYKYLTGRACDFSDLLPRVLKWLQQEDRWVDAIEIKQVSIREKYPIEIIDSLINRLQELENIGYLKGKFKYYPPSEDKELRQQAIDNYEL